MDSLLQHEQTIGEEDSIGEQGLNEWIQEVINNLYVLSPPHKHSALEPLQHSIISKPYFTMHSFYEGVQRSKTQSVHEDHGD